MVKIPVFGGHFALVDDDDAHKVQGTKWYLSSGGYAVTTKHVSGNHKDGIVQESLSMSRILMGCTKGDGKVVDHRNLCKLDNQKSNLRPTTDLGNRWNTPPRNGSATGYKGVRVNAKCSTFNASIQHCLLGHFDTAELAALAYDQEARIRFGDMAWLNFPKVTDYAHVQPNESKITGERTSKVVGVSYSAKRKAKQKWRCTWKAKHLGWFVTEEEAAYHLQKVKNESSIS